MARAAKELQSGATTLMPEHTNARRSAYRMGALDSLRGFFLVNMTLTHMPTRASAWANEMFGYVSSAEGFVFVGALLVGWLYKRRIEEGPPGEARRRILRNAARVYRYHLLLLIIAFTAAASAAIVFHSIALQNLLDYYWEAPAIAVPAAAALLYQPPLLDILPIFVISLLFSPLVLRTAERVGWRQILMVSGCIWLLAQFHLRAGLYAVFAQAGFPIPLREMGSFDLFGWQFLWISGMAAGGRLTQLKPRLESISRPTLVVAWLIVALLFFCRHLVPLDQYTGPALFDFLVNKWHLGVLRLVNFAAIAILLIRFGQGLADTAVARALALPGRRSLEVFSAHVLISFVVLGASSASDPQFEPWQDAIIVVLAVGSLFVAGAVAEARRNRPGLRRSDSSRSPVRAERSA